MHKNDEQFAFSQLCEDIKLGYQDDQKSSSVKWAKIYLVKEYGAKTKTYTKYKEYCQAGSYKSKNKGNFE